MEARGTALGALVGMLASFGAALARGEPAAPAPNGATIAKGSTRGPAPTAADRATNGVVMVERAGRRLALGFVLAGDGRILTSLAPLDDGDGIDVRYADGSVVRAVVDHRDRVWGLALLVPEGARARGEGGLLASEADPLRSDAKLATFTAAPHGKARPLALSVKGHGTFLGEGDALLRDALDLAGKLGAKDLGAPIVDETGHVVGMIARGCVPLGDRSACSPVPLGAPVSALRAFLSGAHATPPPSSPWLGVQVVADAVPFARGVRVALVKPASPADEAHLRGGEGQVPADLVVAVDGVPVGSPEALSDLIRARAVGERVRLLVVREGTFLEVPVILRAAPPTVEVSEPPPPRENP